MPPSLSAFRSWLEERGVQTDGRRPQHDRDRGGVCVVATRALTARVRVRVAALQAVGGVGATRGCAAPEGCVVDGRKKEGTPSACRARAMRASPQAAPPAPPARTARRRPSPPVTQCQRCQRCLHCLRRHG